MPYSAMLEVESDGPILRLTLARPEVRNALNDGLIDLLSETFSNLPPGTRCVTITGAGTAFCAGGDLEWMRKAASYTEEQNFEDAMRIARLWETISRCPAAVIARVNGHAFGGGCGLVSAADAAIAADGSLFAFSEPRLGLIPATISRVVIDKIGRGHSRALFATGETFEASRALCMGLVHEVVAPDELDAAVAKKIRSVLACGPEAVASSKRLALDPPGTLEEASRLLAATRSGDEAKEGISAFLGKRRAAFFVEA